ncbi:metallophosphoesterase family protein [Candidatus Micrarchaeota archaeon]|nr:metallophosphoesterase family protein [Candidatus Micrarchaeota archaeon]
MRILAFSDLHEEEAALESLANRSEEYDHVFICGDSSHTEHFAEAVLDAFPNAFIIPGNWDSERANALLSRAPGWVHGRRVEIGDGLNVVGFGFSPPTPFGTYGEMSEAEIYAQMSKLPIDGNTLLMLHCPPKGHFDLVHLVRRIGSESILRIIEEKRPLAAFFGHAHENIGTSKLGNTELVKLPPANSMRAASLTITDKRITTQFITL